MFRLTMPPGYIPRTIRAHDLRLASTTRTLKFAQWWRQTEPEHRAGLLDLVELTHGRDRVMQAADAMSTARGSYKTAAHILLSKRSEDPDDAPPHPNHIEVEEDDDDEDIDRTLGRDTCPDEFSLGDWT